MIGFLALADNYKTSGLGSLLYLLPKSVLDGLYDSIQSFLFCLEKAKPRKRFLADIAEVNKHGCPVSNNTKHRLENHHYVSFQKRLNAQRGIESGASIQPATFCSPIQRYN